MPFRVFTASVLALSLVAAGCGEADSSPGAPPPTVERTGAPSFVRVYFLRDAKVSVSTRSGVEGSAVAKLRTAIEGLLEGPTKEEQAAGVSSEIPAGAELESLDVNSGTAAIELSTLLSEAAMAQVVYTLTQYSAVHRVRLEGEVHYRDDFEADTPPILVESPFPGQHVSTPLHIRGTANTFEATFNAELVDSDGRVLAKRFVTATSGSGTRGTFAAELPFELSRDGPGEVVAFEISAEDGERMNEVRIPVQITLVP